MKLKPHDFTSTNHWTVQVPSVNKQKEVELSNKVKELKEVLQLLKNAENESKEKDINLKQLFDELKATKENNQQMFKNINYITK